MKQILFLCTTMLLLFGCKSKVTCPICQGEGTVFANGEEQRCLTCKGEGELSEKEYKATISRLNSMKQMYMNASSNATTAPTEEAMETCPYCFGSGANGSYTCGFCQGTGQVSSAMAAQGRHVVGGGSSKDFYPSATSTSNSGSSSSADNSCHSCNGTGDCQHCKGVGVVDYEDSYGLDQGAMTCPICKGTKRCNVCNGSGHI